MDELNYPMCPNHCFKDHLACHRGMSYFNKDNLNKKIKRIYE